MEEIDTSSGQNIIVIPIEENYKPMRTLPLLERKNTGILDEELDAEDLYQKNKEWLTPDEDQSICVDKCDFNDISAFIMDTDEDFNFNMNYDPSIEAHEDAIKEDVCEVNQDIENFDVDSLNLFEEKTNKEIEEAPEPKPKKKVGRKKIPTGMEQRKDVVLKKVLRKIRNFYWKDFQTCTNFPIKKRGKGDELFLKESLNTYIRKALEQDPKPGMIRTLINLMCVKDGKKKENLIYQTLYKFSFTRFKKVTRNSNFRYLVKRYSKVVDRQSLTMDECIGLEMIVNVTNKSK